MNIFKKIKKAKGFTLIELLVALSIIVITFISIVSSFPFGLSVNKNGEDLTVASYLCQEKIEELVSQGYDNINTGTVESRQRVSSDSDSNLYNYERETIVNYVDGSLNDSASDLGMKKISVSVYYIDSFSKTEKEFNITTLISKR